MSPRTLSDLKNTNLVENPQNKDLKSTKIRFHMLAYVCLSGFGYFYVFNSPSVLVTQLESVNFI